MLRKVAWSNGRYLLWLLVMIIAPVIWYLIRLFMLLDTLYYPKLSLLRPHDPVIILGHPRSGTTFLQRLLALEPKSGAFRTWEMFVPSILLRRVLKPLVTMAAAADLHRVQHAKRGHGITLDGVDEEEGLFLHYLDSEILTFISPEMVTDRRYSVMARELGWNDHSGWMAPIRFLREAIKRQCYIKGTEQIIINSNPSLFRIRSLLQEFPEAKFIFIKRDPEETIPSWFSLHKNVLRRNLSPEKRLLFFREKYRWSLEFYRYYSEVMGTIPPGQLMEIEFNELTKSPDSGFQLIQTMFAFAGITPCHDSLNKIRRTLEKPKKRPHRNDPISAFGIENEELQRDLADTRM